MITYEKITINDIANLAGVSKSTVSRYLNNKDISDSTKEKIKTIIDEYGYEPNAFAQSLRAKNILYWYYNTVFRFFCKI